MTNPCKDCEFRHPCCHSECKVYKAWKDELHEEKKAKKDWIAATNFLIDSVQKNKRRLHMK